MTAVYLILGMEGSPVRCDNPPIFRVSSVTCGSETIVFVGGELDVCTAPELERELQQGRARGVRRVIIDLEQVEFADLRGLEPIVSLACDPGAVSVFITPGSRPVQTLLGLSGLGGQLNIVAPH